MNDTYKALQCGMAFSEERILPEIEVSPLYNTLQEREQVISLTDCILFYLRRKCKSFSNYKD